MDDFCIAVPQVFPLPNVLHRRQKLSSSSLINNDCNLNLNLSGASDVRKLQIINYFIARPFDEAPKLSIPVPTYHQGKTVTDCVERVVHIWEMPSEDRTFRFLSRYSAVVLAFDVTDRESFDDIQLRMSVVEQSRFADTEEKQWVVLVGNKYDLMNDRVGVPVRQKNSLLVMALIIKDWHEYQCAV